MHNHKYKEDNSGSGQSPQVFKTKQKTSYKPASKGKRFIAGLLDFFISAVLIALISKVLFAINEGGASTYIQNILVTQVAALAYWLVLPIVMGATPGKKVFGLEIISFRTKRKASFGQLFMREAVGKFISVIFLLIGYITIFFQKYNRAWHDSIGGTIVVEKR